MYVPTPAWPDSPDARFNEADVPLRYEDIAQDGRLMVAPLAALYGEVVWRGLADQGAVAETARSQGIVPILTRLVLTGGGGPFRPDLPLHVTGAYDLAHSVDAAGEVDRLYLRMWARARGRTGHAYEQLTSAVLGAEMDAGHAYAEHVFTRLFAERSERRVVRLDLPGMPPVPPAVFAPPPADTLLAPPAGATLLGQHTESLGFSLGHTDSNQHVNSLVYPRLFEEAVLRLLRSLGRSTARLVRHADMAYRKPFFAGDEASVSLSLWQAGEHLVATGTFAPPAPAGTAARPSVFVRLVL